MKTKHYLVSWSGGLDSTYLIYDLLRKNQRVSAVYTKIQNNTAKNLREHAAIAAIRPIFEINPNFKLLGENEVNINMYGAVSLAQVPAWVFP